MSEPRVLEPQTQPYVLLRAAGVSLLLDLTHDRLPSVRHWGADLGPLDGVELAAAVTALRPPLGDSPMDVADQVTILPEHASGWLGRPGLEGGRAGRDWSTAFQVRQAWLSGEPDGDQRLVVAAVDPVAELFLSVEIELHTSGLLRLRAELGNDGAEPFSVGALRLALPVPRQAVELFDLYGRHTMERIPQRQPFGYGVHSRESRMGRPGLDSAYLLMAGTAGFGFRHGDVWGIHLGWSGNQNTYAERIYNGARSLGAAELLEQDEVVLAPGERYRTPWTFAGYGEGMDGVAARFHRFLRSRPQHPQRPRPVLVNTWEAVYFNHSLPKFQELAARAAEVGAERFVLDDGWFSGRRDDTTSLGDWSVSPAVWPDGLGPLVDHVTALGMQFGLWVEPEMVNLKSDLARAHPEWLFSAGGRPGLPSRHQYVLDLGHAGAYEHVLKSLDSLLSTYDIAYLKWDHNRNLNDAGHTPDGTPGVHAHTLAVYRLLDELRERYPRLEIESCAGGGGRIDLGILERTDRVWPSDCIDALERQQIQSFTQLLLPPELMGTHIGSHEAHTTGRQHSLTFRAITGLWGHLGIEWDLTTLEADELAEVARWVDLHKRLRGLLHTGTVVNVDHPDPAVALHGVVGEDQREAVFAVTALSRSTTWPPGPARLPGLDPDLHYVVRAEPALDPHHLTRAQPNWMDAGVTLTGRVLASAGLELAPLNPEQAYLIMLRAV